MQAKIRSATAADIGALVDLENRSFVADRISRASFRRLVSARSAAVIVAADGSTLGGYAVVLFREGSSMARLYSLAVDPDFRGFGRELLAAAETQAKERGCRSMRLEVREDNARAANLYIRSGYRRFGEKPGYYADGATALRFEKDLAAPMEIARLTGTTAA